MKRAPRNALLAVLLLSSGLTGIAQSARAQDLRAVPRNRTLITQGWDFYNQVPSPTNLSPYSGVLLHERNVLNYTVNEALFFTNHVTNELVPWQARGFTYNADFTEVTIALRPGVRWSDGQAFTAEDVAFTFAMLRGAAPDMMMSSGIKEWVASEEVVDPLTLRIHLAKPGPRWVQDTLATGQTTRFIVVPKHIWQGKDPRSFNDLDLAQGWPVGTGPYKLVRTDSGAMVFDRRDSWWAVDAGLVPALPAPERIIYRPATTEALPQLFSSNEIDMGRALPVGALEAARGRNPNLVSWNEHGPVWGITAGCTYRLAFNNQSPAFSNPDVRNAVAAMIDRDQVVDLAFEGSAPVAYAPFSSYPGMQAYVAKLDDIIKAATGKPDRGKAERLLTGKGFSHGADGKWRKPDGSPWQLTIISQQSDPIAPIVTRQLQNGGIDTVFRGSQDTAYFDALTSGNYEAAIATHCGSLYDPWQTLEHFHSKYAPPAGSRGGNVRAITRYANPELDGILGKMEAMRPSPDDPAYIALTRAATTIVMRDMPQVTLSEEFHPVTFNTTYWTGWPSAKQPYVAPFQAWEGFALAIHHLKARQ